MGLVLAFLSALCFSVTNIVLKKGMQKSAHNGLWTITFVNTAILASALLIMAFFKGWPDVNRQGIILFAAAGFLINMVGRPLLYASIRMNGSSKAVAIKNAAPVFTVLFAVTIIGEQITPGPWTGIGLIFAGLFILAVQLFREDPETARRTGYVLALFSAVSYGIGQALTKEAMNVLYEPILGVFLGVLISFVLLTVVEIFKVHDSVSLFLKFHFRSTHFIWAGVLTSFALLFFYLAVSLTYVSYAVAILAADPVLTVIFARILLKKEEAVTPLTILTAILVFAGAGTLALFSVLP
ncbi:DMT family transporter [Alteribacter natronophilus]|uniref:DMT family transporter n=1 Tax=Alteribacter natronophilus TaxID=2583810 RepID=UPI00110D8E33|nr:DMT family transporter [Alteribacter natronophilus]TMW73388.1 DMT family transporter [Alteribacter natronophilus]